MSFDIRFWQGIDRVATSSFIFRYSSNEPDAEMTAAAVYGTVIEDGFAAGLCDSAHEWSVRLILDNKDKLGFPIIYAYSSDKPDKMLVNLGFIYLGPIGKIEERPHMWYHV